MISSGRPVRRVMLLAGGLLAGLAAAEGTARLFFPSRANGFRLYKYIESERGKFCGYDATLGWSGVPGAEDTFEWADSRSRVRQNSHGFRGSDHPFERTEKRRLVVLGDSYVWGFGVNEDEIFTRRMERLSPSPLEVVNLGVSGYGTDQECLLWEARGRSWKPDDVYLCVTFFTDVYDNLLPVRYGYPKPVFQTGPDGKLRLTNVPVPPRDKAWADRPVEAARRPWPRLAAILDHSDLACLLVSWAARHKSLAELLAATGLLPPAKAGYRWEAPFYRVPPGEDMRKYYGLTLRIMARLNDAVRADGARLTLVVVPAIAQVYPDVWDRFAAEVGDPATLDPVLPNRMMDEVGRRLGVRVIDLLPPLREAGRSNRRLYFPLNLHWTADGHRAVAEALLAAEEGGRK